MRIANGALVEIEIGRRRIIARVLPARRHVKNLKNQGHLYSPDYVLVRPFDPETRTFLNPVCYLRSRIIRTFPRFRHGWLPVPKLPTLRRRRIYIAGTRCKPLLTVTVNGASA